MKTQTHRSLLTCLLFGLLAVSMPASAQDTLSISEFMASNTHTLVDEDGAFSDWIEIHNAPGSPFNVDGWFLTDDPTALMKWRLPSTNVAANGYLVVFASNKNRQVPGAPLHTNFKLSSKAGSYLALVKPDGVTVVSSYSPYPIQVADISYGIPTHEVLTPLVSSGAVARVFVPGDASLGISWFAPGFDDSSWTSATTGIGYETDIQTNFAPVQIADSVAEFSGVQGSNNWFYGYWNRSADSDGVYADGEFTPFAASVWRVAGGGWDLAVGVAPWTQLTSNGGRPNGLNNGEEHWAIRRYVSEVQGSIRITGSLLHPVGACGDGATVHIFVDGIEVYQQPISQISIGYSLITTVALGSHVDFAIDPGPASDDNCDLITFTATIRTADPAVTVVANSIADWSYSGRQGEKNWFYGDYNFTFDTVPNYQTTNFTAFPSDGGPPSASNFWNGEKWVWYNGDPPRDVIGQVYCFPNGNNVGSGQIHWVIRRWVSQIRGTLMVDWHLAKQDTSVQGGSGVTGRVFLNGAQKDSATIANGDSNGVFRTVSLTGVQIGDVIDFALDPTGVAGTDDYSDGSFLNATIYGFANLSNQITSSIQGLMQGSNATAYIRIPFTVTDPTAFNFLTLRMKYDDGFIALINGGVVTTRNAPLVPDWNVTATGSRSDAAAIQYEDIDISEWLGLLHPGTNVLAIQGLNASANDSDFLILPELRATALIQDTSTPAYFSLPTPGAANGSGNTNLGPLIVEVVHTPSVPFSDQDLVVTATVAPSFHPIQSVSLIYRIMFGAEVTLPMLDDGQHGDGLAGDGVFGASISATNFVPGQMVRYYIVARDTNSNYTRLPSFLNSFATPQYLGTIVYLAQTNNLPIFHWFVQTPSAADQVAGTRCSAFYNGVFYDNIFANLHGQSSSGFPQKSYGFNANPGFSFEYSPTEHPVSGWDLLTIYADKSHLRNLLSYGTYHDAKSPYHITFNIRIQQNGTFFSDANYCERGDDTFLSRLGLDPNGAFYKMYNTFTSLADTTIGSSQLGAYAEKKTRKNEGNADLVALLKGVQLTGTAQVNYLYDNLDIPEIINFLTAMTITGDVDCCHKNYYFYRDTERTGEWQMFPWDVDLSFGRVWNGTQTYWDEVLHPDTGLYVGNNNSVPIALLGRPEIKQMYQRRLRTLMEELLQAPGTPVGQLRYEGQMDQLLPLIAPDAALYSQKWTAWGQGSAVSTCCSQTVAQAVTILKTNYLPARRTYLFTNLVASGDVPQTQPTNAIIKFGAIEFNPISANQAQEYVQLLNTNSYAVDISGWKLTGAGINYTFRGGVVIPGIGGTGVLYVTPDVVAFRARPLAPKGGLGIFVQGDYKGQLTARGGLLQLIDKTGRVVSGTNYLGNPSLPQLYLRITEIMYHPPAPPAGSPYGSGDFEYLELKNTGPIPIDLTGVHFTNGLDFNFTGSTVSNLAAGQTVLLVKNLAAFASRYPGATNVAGTYGGSLNNGGEKIELDDAVGEVILEFAYDNAWYPITDGPGASLVIVDETASPDSWGLQSSWRPSAHDGGSPGVVDPPPVVVEPILVNEVLSHSNLPLLDTIELYNPNANDVNIGGWFISDDLNYAKKFRILDGRMIPAGGYAVFDETDFNTTPGVFPSFAFSSKGSQAYLFSGDANTNLTGYFHGYQFGAAEADVSFGRYITSIGAEHFVAQSLRTFGATNAGPKVGPLVINEIMYRPPDLAGNNDNVGDEFIELYNVSTNAVSLFEAVSRTNTWRLRGTADFDFPTNVVLPASNYLLVVSFNPANHALLTAFQNKYGVPLNVPVFGPYSGTLGNTAGTIDLEKPDVPSAGQVPYILADKVEYTNAAALLAADGNGASLQRLHPSEYGDDPINWAAAAPNPGGPFVGGTPPVITSQPGNINVPVGTDVLLSVSASGTPPLRYQWRLNGQNLPGATAATLSLPNIQFTQAGAYNVFVFNGGGYVVGTNFTVTPRTALKITAQPISRVATNGGSTNFTVSAVGTGTFRYQWRFNGGNILNATNATTTNAGVSVLTVTNISIASQGTYDCVVSDDFDTTNSQPASLTIVYRPVYTLMPTSPTTAVAGRSASSSLSVTGTPPMTFLWRKLNVGILTPGTFNGYIVSTPAYSSLVLTNLTTNNAGTYFAVVSNLVGVAAGGGPNGFSFSNILTVLADTDLDGLPDVFQAAHPGVIGAGDEDLDGMSNAAEYFAGTDPFDPTSNLKLSASGAGGGALQFSAVSNRTYTVQYTDRLNPAQWKKLADVLAQNVTRIETVADPNSRTNRLYRIVTPIQP